MRERFQSFDRWCTRIRIKGTKKQVGYELSLIRVSHSGESEGKEEKKKKKNGLEFIVERVLAFWSK